MLEETKPKRPIIAIILAVLLCLKLLSGLSIIYNLSGVILYIVLIQLIMVTFVIFSMNTLGGGAKMIKLMIAFVSATMVFDILVIALMFEGRDIPEMLYPRAIGAEITYLITILYLVFSKKLKRFKSFGLE